MYNVHLCTEIISDYYTCGILMYIECFQQLYHLPDSSEASLVSSELTEDLAFSMLLLSLSPKLSLGPVI